MKTTYSPTLTPLARAVCQSLPGRPPAPPPVGGFSLLEIMLVVGGLSLLSAGSFMIYQSAANNADVKTEQANVQALASNADRIYGALGSYQGLTTTQAIADRVPPQSMVSGTGLLSRWSQPVLVEPVAIDSKPNAGMQITYNAVPSRSCVKFAQAASGGMFDVRVGGNSVMSDGTFQTDQAISLCDVSPATPVVFTYYGGATGLAGSVLPPVSLPPASPPIAPPPVAPPPAPPPALPPTPPPAPGCGAAPTSPATGTTPPGQSCSFVWNAVAAPTCWAPLALCTPVITAPPPAPPPSTPPPATPPPPAPPGSTPLCNPGAPTLTPQSQTATCNSGRSTPAGASTFTQNRIRTIDYTCPDPFGARVASPATYSPWTPTEAAACAPICVAPPTLNETRAGPPQSQPAAGPFTQTVNESQAAPGPFSQTVNETAPAAGPFSRLVNESAPAAGPFTQTLGCPSGQTGAITQTRTAPNITRTATQTRTAPDVTRTATQTRTAPNITRTATQTRTAPDVTRSTTQSRTTTYACPAPTGAYTSTVGAWSAPGAPYGAWSAPAYSPWSAPGAPYGAWSAPAYSSWSAPGAPYGAWSAPAYSPWSANKAPYSAWSSPAYTPWATTSNTCTTPPPACVGSPGSPPFSMSKFMVCIGNTNVSASTLRAQVSSIYPAGTYPSPGTSYHYPNFICYSAGNTSPMQTVTNAPGSGQVGFYFRAQLKWGTNTYETEMLSDVNLASSYSNSGGLKYTRDLSGYHYQSLDVGSSTSVWGTLPPGGGVVGNTFRVTSPNGAYYAIGTATDSCD